MEVIRFKKVFKQHSWKKDEDGNIDEFAWDFDFHNGVVCENCGESICVCCDDYTECDTECYIAWNECPHCHKKLLSDSEMNYCKYCGDKVEYNKDSEEVLIEVI